MQFRVAKRTLPGPYTLILPASSALPKRILDLQTGKSKKRKTVGIRWPDHFVTQARHHSVLSCTDCCLTASQQRCACADGAGAAGAASAGD